MKLCLSKSHLPQHCSHPRNKGNHLYWRTSDNNSILLQRSPKAQHVFSDVLFFGSAKQLDLDCCRVDFQVCAISLRAKEIFLGHQLAEHQLRLSMAVGQPWSAIPTILQFCMSVRLRLRLQTHSQATNPIRHRYDDKCCLECRNSCRTIVPLFPALCNGRLSSTTTNLCPMVSPVVPCSWTSLIRRSGIRK